MKNVVLLVLTASIACVAACSKSTPADNGASTTDLRPAGSSNQISAAAKSKPNQLSAAGRIDTGIKLIGSVDANGRQAFAIIQGAEEAAAAYVIQELMAAEIMLMNSEDEGGEGATTIRKTASGFAAMNGGHGWQGDWVSMTAEQVRKRIIELAPVNSGGHWSREGTITRD